MSPSPLLKLRRDSSDSGRNRLQTSSISRIWDLTIAIAAGKAALSSTTTVFTHPMASNESKLSKAWRAWSGKVGEVAAAGVVAAAPLRVAHRVPEQAPDPAPEGAGPSQVPRVSPHKGGELQLAQRPVAAAPELLRQEPVAAPAEQAASQRNTLPRGWRSPSSDRARRRDRRMLLGERP